MVGTINSIGYGVREHRVNTSLIAHAVGNLAGGATIATACWLCGIPVRNLVSSESWLLVLVGALAGVYALREAGILRAPMPQLRRQVPRSWSRRFPPEVFSVSFGFLLGLALPVHVQAGSLYPVIALAAVSESYTLALLLGLAYGAGRFLPLVSLELMRRRRGWTSLLDVHDFVDAKEGIVGPVNAIAMAAFFTLILALGVTLWSSEMPM